MGIGVAVRIGAETGVAVAKYLWLCIKLVLVVRGHDLKIKGNKVDRHIFFTGKVL